MRVVLGPKPEPPDPELWHQELRTLANKFAAHLGKERLVSPKDSDRLVEQLVHFGKLLTGQTALREDNNEESSGGAPAVDPPDPAS